LWADFPIISLKAWIKMLIQPLMALVILTESDVIDALTTTVKRMAFILLPLSIVLIKYYPVYGRYYTLGGVGTYGGVTTYKNTLGALCMFAGLLILWNLIFLLRDKTQPSRNIHLLVNISMIGITIWLMLTADSATSLATFIIGSFILFLFNLRFMKTKVVLIKITLIVLVIISSVSVFFPTILENAANMLGRDPTLTGRTVIWERVLSVDTNPLFGPGYSNFWQGERASQLLDVNQVPLNQAHNGYLEVYKNLGLIGLILLGLTIFTSISKVSNTLILNNSLGMLQIAYMAAILLSNVTEASYGIKSILWFIFILISIKYPANMKDERPVSETMSQITDSLHYKATTHGLLIPFFQCFGLQ
jgi:O-antigen ligase